jgi:hypothetical protein
MRDLRGLAKSVISNSILVVFLLIIAAHGGDSNSLRNVDAEELTRQELVNVDDQQDWYSSAQHQNRQPRLPVSANLFILRLLGSQLKQVGAAVIDKKMSFLGRNKICYFFFNLYFGQKSYFLITMYCVHATIWVM